jgi:hypothetical protein
MDDFDSFYDEWVDTIVNTQPLTSSRLEEFTDVININQQLVNRIYSIRRHLEIENSNLYNYTNTNTNTNTNTLRRDILSSTPIFNSSLINNLFGILLEETENFNTTQDFEDVKVTLTQEQFDKLPFEIVNLNNVNTYKKLECNICMDEYQKDDKVIKLSCKHYFHTDCIKNWLCNERVTCPICRKDIRETL